MTATALRETEQVERLETRPSITAPRLEVLPLEQLRESPLNTRKHFDPAKLAELKASIQKSGILTPLLVRPNTKLANGKGIVYEIAAGHRRFRAGRDAGVLGAPAIVREMDDATFLEILTIENLQREDVHALEEAQGYKNLLTIDGYDIKKIADRVGKSESYVYDRLKLLQLTKEAQKLFFDGAFTAGHAIILSRLSPTDQKRAMEWNPGSYRDRGGLWQSEHVLHSPDQEEMALDEDEDARKAVSVRELQGWVDRNVRFDEKAKDVPDLFPETARKVHAAVEQKDKIVKITHEYTIEEEARDEKERTIGPRSWARADGKHDSKLCDYSVLGVVAVGPDRGQAYRVCINKDKCTVHWGDLIRQRKAREKEREKADAAGKPTDRQKEIEREQRAREQRELEERERNRNEQRWRKAVPFVRAALAKSIKKHELSYLAELVLAECTDYGVNTKQIEQLVPQGVTADSILRHCAARIILGDINAYQLAHGHGETITIAKKLGVNLQQVLEDAAPEPKAEKAPEKKPAAKKPAKAAKKAKARK